MSACFSILMAKINCRYPRNCALHKYATHILCILSAINSIISYLLFINTNTSTNLGSQGLFFFVFFPSFFMPRREQQERYLFVVSLKCRCMNFVLKLMRLVVFGHFSLVQTCCRICLLFLFLFSLRFD